MYYQNIKNSLVTSGYIPLPIKPKSKIPAAKWAHPDYIPPEGYKGYGVGIKCGVGENSIAGVDCDITNIDIASFMENRILELCGETIYRIGQAPKSFFVYRAEKTGIRKLRSKHFENLGHIEFWGAGQQFVAFGTHPDTLQPYTWPGILGDITEVKAKELPILSVDKMEAIIKIFEEKAEALGYKTKDKPKTEIVNQLEDDPFVDLPIGLKVGKVRELLKNIDADCGRDIWRNIGMALHHESKGSDIGLDLWDTWSATGTKYKEGETAQQWDSFGSFTGQPLTAAYLIKIGKKDPKIEAEEIIKKVYIPTPDNRPTETTPLITLNGHRVLSRGSLMALGAQAGQGKSSVCSRILSTVVNDNAPHLGLKAECTTAHLIDSEQSQIESHKQWRNFMRCSDLDPVKDATPSVISYENIRAMATVKERRAYLETVLKADTIADILILDGLSDFISAVNDEAECTDIVGLISSVAHERKIGIVCTLHMNPAGASEKMRGVLGSELWRKAEFCAIIRKSENDTRELTSGFSLGKNRSDSDALTIHFKWCDFENMHMVCDAPEVGSKKNNDNKLQEICDAVLSILQTENITDIKQSEIFDLCQAQRIGRISGKKALETLVDTGLLIKTNEGRAYVYNLSAEGKTYGLQLA